MCSHLPSSWAMAGRILLLALQDGDFHELPAVTAPGTSADGGQRTAKGYQPQAACKSRAGFSIQCCTEARRDHEGGREWTRLQPGWPYTCSCWVSTERIASPSLALISSLPTCPLYKHIAWRATEKIPVNKWFGLYSWWLMNSAFLFQMNQVVLTSVDHTNHASAGFVTPENESTSAEPLQRSLPTASKLENSIDTMSFKLRKNRTVA